MNKLAQNKINILHVTFDMRIGGTEMVIKNIIDGNKNDSLCMSIFCIEEPLGPWGEDMRTAGVKVCSTARKNGFDLSVIKAIRQHIKRNGIDILHCHQYTPWVYSTLAALGTGTKVIFTEHGRFYPDSRSWKRSFINPFLAFLTYKITAISYATKQALIDYEYLSESKIEVIYNGIKSIDSDEHNMSDVKDKLGLSPTTFVFGTIARLDPIKNHKMMLNAYALVRKKLKDSVLVIVGDGEMKEELEKLVIQLKIKPYVIFTGYIPYPQNYLKVFDIFLLSSLSEGTSMTLLEAMSISKPCIVTDAGGNKEIIVNKETGYVTDNNNVNQFYSAMISLALDRNKTEIFGKAAKQRFINQFDEAQMSKQYERCYKI